MFYRRWKMMNGITGCISQGKPDHRLHQIYPEENCVKPHLKAIIC